MDLKNKVALVTGGARRIGRAIAMDLAAHGTSIAVHYRTSQSEADAVVAEISSKGGKAQTFHADLEHVAEIEQMVAKVLDTFGRIDILDQLSLDLRAHSSQKSPSATGTQTSTPT